jgi:hypothetical protein
MKMPSEGMSRIMRVVDLQVRRGEKIVDGTGRAADEMQLRPAKLRGRGSDASSWCRRG